MTIESVSITPGTGKDIAVDTVAGKEFQVIKLGLGAEDALDVVVDSGQQTKANSLPVVLASDSDPLSVGGALTVVTATFTRPADTTAYAAGDVVADSTSAPTVITLTNAVLSNGDTGILMDVKMVDSANQATPGLFELWLFNAAPGLDNDNAAFTPTDTELQTLLAVIPLTVSYAGDATSGAGGNRVYQSDVINRPVKAGGSTRNLYGELVVRNAYTPVSAESFYFIVNILPD